MSRILNPQTYDLSQNEVIGFQSELQEWLRTLPETLKTKIDLIQMALEEESASEMGRINNTLKGIVNQLIVSLENLRSEHLIDLIQALRQQYLQ